MPRKILPPNSVRVTFDLSKLNLLKEIADPPMVDRLAKLLIVERRIVYVQIEYDPTSGEIYMDLPVEAFNDFMQAFTQSKIKFLGG